jgi:hypothetical protein
MRRRTLRLPSFTSASVGVRRRAAQNQPFGAERRAKKKGEALNRAGETGGKSGHAVEAGADVVGLVWRHHGRIAGMHLRDFKNGEQVPLGIGKFPLRAVAEVVRDTGWSGWVLNEGERLTSKPGDSRRSRRARRCSERLGKRDQLWRQRLKRRRGQ